MSSTKPILPSSPATTRKPSGPLRKDELEAVLSYLYLVAVPQIYGVYTHPIDVGSVERTGVPDPKPLLAGLLAPEDLRMLPGDRDVVEEDLALGAAPYRHDPVSDVVHPSPRGALDLVELDERRPLVPIITRATGLLGLFFVTEARSIGDGRLRVCHEACPTLSAELHVGGNLGTALGTVVQETPPPRRPSPRRTRANSSGESETLSRRTSSTRIKSILPCITRRR